MDSIGIVNNDSYLISIVMPIYFPNLIYLKRALDSLILQEMKSFELIIVSDGHSPLVDQLLDNYEKLEIKLIKNEVRCGFQKSLNIGIKHATANLIARMDSDDISLPNRLNEQYQMFLNDDLLALAGSNTYIIDENDNIIGKRIYPYRYNEIKKVMLCYNPFAHSSVMFRKDVVLNLGGYDNNMMLVEDYDLWMKISSANKSKNSSDFLVCIRNHPDSIRGSNFQNMQFQSLKIKKNGYKNLNYNLSLDVYKSLIISIFIMCIPKYITAILFSSFLKIGYFNFYGFLRMV